MRHADAELGAYGIANLCAGMFGAPLSVGIPARNLAVVRCGGSTRLSNLPHVVFLAAILWFGWGMVSYIPLRWEEIGVTRIVCWAYVWHSERMSFEDRRLLHKHFGAPPLVEGMSGVTATAEVSLPQ